MIAVSLSEIEQANKSTEQQPRERRSGERARGFALERTAGLYRRGFLLRIGKNHATCKLRFRTCLSVKFLMHPSSIVLEKGLG